MLKKEQRVSRVDFLSFLKTGKRFHSTHLTLIYSPSPTFHGSVVVSKKVSKLAVTRNALRRRIYAQMQQLKDTSPGIYIVMVKPGFERETRLQALQEIKALIGRMVKTA